jgi:hypothetical protein
MDHYTPFSPEHPELPPVEQEDETDIDALPTPDEKQARIDYLKSLTPERKSKRGLLIGILVVLILLLAGGGAYLYLQHTSNAKVVTKKITSVSQVATTSDGAQEATMHYISKGADLNLSFDYPDNWTVSPASGGNANDGTITVNSPVVNVTSATGVSASGKVSVMIRPSSATIDELSSGQAAVAQNSVQIAYTTPTTDQYQYPYLTFVHLKGGSNPSAVFEEILVTGTSQFTAGESITESNVEADPIISASFYNCASTACPSATAAPLSINNDTWLNSTIGQQTLAIIQSLQLN